MYIYIHLQHDASAVEQEGHARGEAEPDYIDQASPLLHLPAQRDVGLLLEREQLRLLGRHCGELAALRVVLRVAHPATHAPTRRKLPQRCELRRRVREIANTSLLDGKHGGAG